MATYVGDHPTWPLTNERWDSPDPVLISTLINLTFVRMWGNLIGPTWGCLTPPTLTTTDYLTNGNRVEISACTFGYVWQSLAGGTADFEGGPVIYDPSRDIQAESTIYIDPTYEGSNAWLWFRRRDGLAAVDMRAHFPNTTEEVQATPTQVKEYVEFEVTAEAGGGATINETQGWFRWAYLPAGGWAGGIPTGIVLLSFWDGWYKQDLDADAINGLNTFGHVALNVTGLRLGLAQYLQGIANQLAIMLDTANARNDTETTGGTNVEAGTANWHTRPTRGMKQLDEDLATLEAQDLDTRLTTAETNITSLQGLRPLWAAKILSDGTFGSSQYPFVAVPTVPTYSGGVLTITFDNAAPAGLVIDSRHIPQVTIAGTDHLAVRAYWDSTYVLKVRTGDGNYASTDMYNTDVYVTIIGEYA